MKLSKREIEVLRLISAELTINEIAKELFLSNHTVISHCQNIKEKLGVRNVAGVVRAGFEAGYLQLHV
ncbi:MAG: helix-turn-helix transcriptional regulator [Saprospiraceae bacterium]|nr:helix-turn-helix transcriptional regulator [Saprospiraceae bacterium]